MLSRICRCNILHVVLKYRGANGNVEAVCLVLVVIIEDEMKVLYIVLCKILKL